MSARSLRVVTPEGGSSHDLGAAPLTLGGVDSDVPLLGDASTTPIGRIRKVGERVLLEPDPLAPAVLVNDELAREPRELRVGDCVRSGLREIEVCAGSEGLELIVREIDDGTLPPAHETTPAVATAPRLGEAQRSLPVAPVEHRGTSAEPPSVIRPVAFRPEARRTARPGSGAPRLLQRALLPLLVLASGAVLVALLWFAFSSVAVQILVDPAPGALALEGAWFTPHWGNRFLVRPGEYQVVAERDGYESIRQRVVVDASQDQRFAFALAPRPGRLNLTTQPERARVSLDGVDVGETPLAGLEVEAGTHRIRLEAERHLGLERDIVVQGGDAEQSLELALIPNWSMVSVDTVPPGATVSVDGAERGRTPIRLDVDAGAHALGVSLQGYRSLERELVVVANQPQELGPLELAVADGRVSVVTDPPGAILEVDGTYSGKTPREVLLDPTRAHRLRVSKRGYRNVTREIDVGAAAREELRIELPAELGRIEFRITPADAELLLDGRSVGSPGKALELTATPHRVELRKEGFEPKSFEVTPRAGLLKIVEVQLEKRAPVRASVPAPVGAPATVRTAQGQELVLVEGGTFTMGSSRREQGRRSNELQVEARLERRLYLSRKEITNGQFKEFEAAHDSGEFSGLSLDGDAQPVVRVRWEEAVRFCNWLSAKDGRPAAYVQNGDRWQLVHPVPQGHRLPTEAEWAWAARFEAASEPLRYPWGEALPPPAGSGNYADLSAKAVLRKTLGTYNDGFSVSAPVGSFDPNGLGLFDLGGNVAEWVHDYYAIRRPGGARGSGPAVDPSGPPSGRFRVVRGSSWRHASVTQLRTAFRDYAEDMREDVGFRIARYAE